MDTTEHDRVSQRFEANVRNDRDVMADYFGAGTVWLASLLHPQQASDVAFSS